MTAPRALIAEDEPLLAAALTAELAAVWPQLQLAAVVGDGLSAVRQALQLKPDVCFLDIRMPGCSGLDAAQALAEDWPEGTPFPLLVFVTAYDQYALQAFEAQAVDYIVKPADRPRMQACAQRLRARLAERATTDALQDTLGQLRALLGSAGGRPDAAGISVAPPRLEVIQAQVGHVVHFVPVDEVIYFEAADKYVRVVTATKEHLIRTTLKELLPQLDDNRWWQIHRATVVQAHCITAARRDESGKVFLSLRGRSETLTASRLYAHLFKGM